MNDENKDTPVELASGLQLKLERGIVKAALKEAVREWLDEKYKAVGKYTVHAFGAALFAGVIWFILWAGGWHSPLSK